MLCRSRPAQGRALRGVVNEAEMFAEFGSSWVHGGGDPADVSLAWAQHRAAYTTGAIG